MGMLPACKVYGHVPGAITSIYISLYISKKESNSCKILLVFFKIHSLFFHATLQSAYISKSKYLFCKILQGIIVQYVKYSMCENHENTLKFEGTGTLYFKVHKMVVLM